MRMIGTRSWTRIGGAALLGATLAVTGCNTKSTADKQPFGTVDGKAVDIYTLSNAKGMKVRITNYGGIVVSLVVPDKAGKPGDIVLGYNTVDEYVKDTPYFGCIVGRYGNRIANGKFTLDGVEYKLATNNEPGGIPCHLHGGLKGFDKRVWDAEPLEQDGMQGLKLRYVSKDGEEGYPGNLDVTVTYWVTPDNGLKIEYKATTDKATTCNLTNHSYFNLKGDGNGDINDHEVMIAASKFTPVDKGLIPTGELKPVAGTPFDFTTPRKIGERVDADDEQIKFGGGYDHNWALDNQSGKMALAARVSEATSGRVLEVWTTEPGLQFYGGNFLDGKLTGKAGKPYNFRNGFCMETQHYPDSPNQPTFPSTILKPGETYDTTTIYKFSTK